MMNQENAATNTLIPFLVPPAQLTTLAPPPDSVYVDPEVLGSHRPARSDPAEKPRRRARYSTGARKMSQGRMTTRCPIILRDYLKRVSSDPSLPYRTYTQMASLCLEEFLSLLANDATKSLKFVRGRGLREGTSLVHTNTETLVCPATGESVSGLSLYAKAEATAKSRDLSMASFTLTFLLWMATKKHPPSDGNIRNSIESELRLDASWSMAEQSGAQC